MMKIIVLVSSLMLSISCAPNLSETKAEIIEYQNENDGRGNYFFRFVTTNGIQRQESGHLVDAGQPDEHIAVEGFYTYMDNEGNIQTVRYKADENGYSIQPFIPVAAAPGVSPAALASLLGK